MYEGFECFCVVDGGFFCLSVVVDEGGEFVGLYFAFREYLSDVLSEVFHRDHPLGLYLPVSTGLWSSPGSDPQGEMGLGVISLMES